MTWIQDIYDRCNALEERVKLLETEISGMEGFVVHKGEKVVIEKEGK